MCVCVNANTCKFIFSLKLGLKLRRIKAVHPTATTPLPKPMSIAIYCTFASSHISMVPPKTILYTL